MKLTNKQLDKIKKHFKLSKRQIQMVKLIFEGVESNEDLARKMNLSTNSVKVYSRHLFAKMQAYTKLSVALKVMDFLKSKS